jgi:hypothetical protein
MSLFDQWNKKYGDKGLGDTVSRAIDSISGGTIRECGGCKKRKEYLNGLLPYQECTSCNK